MVRWSHLLVPVALVLLILPTAPPPQSSTTPGTVEQAERDLEGLDRLLEDLEPFVERGGGGELRLDREAARRAGHPAGLVALADELLRYQSRLRTTAGNGPPGLVGFPLLAALVAGPGQRALAQLREERPAPPDRTLTVRTVHPCGTREHPVPDHDPPPVPEGTYPDPHAELRRRGFHRTAPYACDPSERDCADDYTRPRGYEGPHGHCPAPAFRDHARVDGRAITIQYGEPNPEVHAYEWPYPTWPLYVAWWHGRY